MRSIISLVIFILSVTWVAATIDTAFAEPSYETFASRARKLVQKTMYDSWSTRRKTVDNSYKTDIPREFDARQYFGSCANVIGDVKDQGNCASSWAVAVASTFTDRLCIASNGQFTDHLSAQNLLSCGDEEKMGCDGGSAFKAWELTMSKGIVTGGNFDSNEGCQPYKNRPCNHYGNSNLKNCSSLRRTQMTVCREKCVNKNYKVKYEDDLHKTSIVYMTSWTNVKQIQQEIMTYGPVTAFMYVHENFMGYKEGIYKSTTGELIGYHHVKLIGWGVDGDGTEYWLAMNSWNSNWGNNGLFKILRGYNFCSIELLVMAGIVNVSQ
ncbi:cathepsin B-like cysteine proteinase 3 [Metopolophium dirhodum]|uniref:cathepsin B-like cysteine proteinase 3 n=1 Tax=Metopolophium dirhodum TaxID=44670 RepID=UPI00298FD996|nr:cathepsin B-like cysteine proteinase 3 [Metopolophium dirhodum]XP_060862943.1 cathepsin B-like cysteine proteinase 3 [Metopolophium dirhodum]